MFPFTHRHVPLVEFDADVPLDPRKGVLLADCDEHIVARIVDVVLAGGLELTSALRVDNRIDLFESDAGELAALVRESLGDQEVEDRDVLMHGVFLLPWRRLHFRKSGADDHLDVLAAQTPGRTTAIHGRVAAAKHDHALSDPLDVAERDAGEPVDADMDVGGRLAAAGNLEIAPAWRAAAHEDGVEVLGEKVFETVDSLGKPHDGTEPGDVPDFLVDHALGQAKAGNLAADHAPSLGVAVEDHHLVAHRGEVSGHGQGSRPRADASDAPAVAALRRAWQAIGDVVLLVGADALKPADGHRLALDPHPPARRLAGSIARPPEDSGKTLDFQLIM